MERVIEPHAMLVERARCCRKTPNFSIPLRFAFWPVTPPRRDSTRLRPGTAACPTHRHVVAAISHRSHGSTSDIRPIPALSTPRDTPRCTGLARVRAPIPKSLDRSSLSSARRRATRRSPQPAAAANADRPASARLLTGVRAVPFSNIRSAAPRLAAALSQRRSAPAWNPDGKTCCRKRRRNSSANPSPFCPPSSLSHRMNVTRDRRRAPIRCCPTGLVHVRPPQYLSADSPRPTHCNRPPIRSPDLDGTEANQR